MKIKLNKLYHGRLNGVIVSDTLDLVLWYFWFIFFYSILCSLLSFNFRLKKKKRK